MIALTRAILIGYYKSTVDICMVGEMQAKNEMNDWSTPCGLSFVAALLQNVNFNKTAGRGAVFTQINRIY